jgi:hypothetical protein
MRAAQPEPLTQKRNVASVYPNLFTTSFNINRPGNFTYVIYDPSGTARESGKGSGLQAAGANLPNGIYVVKIRGKDGEESFKVLKQ